LEVLCRESDRCSALGTAARSNAVFRFSIANMVTDYERVYNYQ